jgi:serine-type D-Ala-D-Ala endopeptidase (penicillin-binding protein 7)
MKFKTIPQALCVIALFCSTSVFATTVQHKNKSNAKAKVTTNKSISKTTHKSFKAKYKLAPATSNIKYTVFNYENGQVLEENFADTIWPVASLTKLMTAFIFVNNTPDLNNCTATITDADIDVTKGTHTKLASNTPYSCKKLLEVMLVASDNYAASALARSVPGWNKPEFVKHMNGQAKNWGMVGTSFVDSSGLSPENRSSVQDYRKLTMNVVKNDYISNISSEHTVGASNKFNKEITYRNSNKLVREYGFDVNLSKTGYIKESGYNLVHLADCSTPIGVIEFGARSSDQRANFVKQKLSKYGCTGS